MEPTTRVGTGWIGLFSSAWLGIWMAQLTPVQLLLPLQVAEFSAPVDWVDSVIGFGAISGFAGLCALISYPVAGALSDRTASRYGRRRPWLVVGLLLFAGSLAVLGSARALWQVGLVWCLSSIGFCVITAALTAMISDQVPVNQRGLVSGWMAAPQAVGTILGVGLITALAVGPRVGYLVMAGLLVLLVLPALRLPDPPLTAPRKRLSAADFVKNLWISPRQHPDFGFVLLSRILVNFGNALGTSLLLYFLMFGLGDAEAELHLLQLIAVYMVFVVLASILLGRLSDRVGRRRIFVFGASIIQALAALLLAVWPSLPTAFVAAGLLGLGYGCFLSVDQALATQVLPSAEDRGKDLGIMNIATTIPQSLAPMLGAVLVAAAGGFGTLFFAAAAAALAGALALLPVRGVR